MSHRGEIRYRLRKLDHFNDGRRHFVRHSPRVRQLAQVSQRFLLRAGQTTSHSAFWIVDFHRASILVVHVDDRVPHRNVRLFISPANRLHDLQAEKEGKEDGNSPEWQKDFIIDRRRFFKSTSPKTLTHMSFSVNSSGFVTGFTSILRRARLSSINLRFAWRCFSLRTTGEEEEEVRRKKQNQKCFSKTYDQRPSQPWCTFGTDIFGTDFSYSCQRYNGSPTCSDIAAISGLSVERIPEVKSEIFELRRNFISLQFFHVREKLFKNVCKVAGEIYIVTTRILLIFKRIWKITQHFGVRQNFRLRQSNHLPCSLHKSCSGSDIP